MLISYQGELLLKNQITVKNVHDLSFGGWVILMLETRQYGLTRDNAVGPIDKRKQGYIASSACKALSWASSSSSMAVFVVRAATRGSLDQITHEHR